MVKKTLKAAAKRNHRSPDSCEQGSKPLQKLFLHNTGCASASLLGSKHCRALGWHSWVSFSLRLAQHRAHIALLPLSAPLQPWSKQLQSLTNCSKLAPPIDVPKLCVRARNRAQHPLNNKTHHVSESPKFFFLQQEIPLIPLCCSGHCPPALCCKNCNVQASACSAHQAPAPSKLRTRSAKLV